MTVPVALDVHVTVLEHDRTPAAGVPIRVVIGAALSWQSADAGVRLVTGFDGSCDWRTSVVLDDHRHKLPTNFFTNLMASRERTRHVQVAIELEYAGRLLAVVRADVPRSRVGDAGTALQGQRAVRLLTTTGTKAIEEREEGHFQFFFVPFDLFVLSCFGFRSVARRHR